MLNNTTITNQSTQITKTLDLREAAELLKMHPQTVRRLAIKGIIPSAKPGKCWVFIEADLVAWLRSRYCQPRQVPEGEEDTQWHYTKGKTQNTGGPVSPHRTAKNYANLLGLPTGDSRKNTKTG